VVLKKVLVFLLFLSAFCFAQEKLNIAVSANARFAVEEIAKVFQKKHRIKINIISSSSGKLASQIIKGAPFDVFLSADMKYPQKLYTLKRAVYRPRVYAYGILILWSFKDKNLSVNRLTEYKKIAVANPKLAPYGRATVEALRFYRLFDKVKEKIIYGESVSQVNQYIIKKLVDAGFTSKSSLFSPNLKEKGYFVDIDENAYSPIKQGAVLISKKAIAEEFYNFLFSKQAKEIFKKYGYKVDE